MQRTNSLEKTWCWKKLKTGEGDDRGQDGWIASRSQWTWVWASSGRWWSTGKAGVQRSMGWQRVRHDWPTEKLQWISWLTNWAHISCSSYTGLWFLYHWTIKELEHQRFDAFLKCEIQKTKIMLSGPITSWQIDGKTMETVREFIFLVSKITEDGDFSCDIKDVCSLAETMTKLDSMLKSRDIVDKGPSSQSYGFSSSHV